MTENVGEDQEQWTPEQRSFMLEALREAEAARQRREVPVGCVFVREGQILARGHNLTNETRNGTRHAELQAIDQILDMHGGDVSAADFPSCELYVTVEPCIMCAGALSLLGIGSVYYGCGNDRFGGCGSILPVHAAGCGTCSRASKPAGASFPCRGGLYRSEAVKLLQDFYICGNPAAPRPHRPLRPAPITS
mmetsp:Transcript_40481/g.89943  ORF Transcript_40481/g.89943 Transcript_40481/m.89943 type:complete len:192 (-) Transcript_40481:595-1170(-)